MDEIRIGVFICHCGSNINGVLDCPALRKYAKTLPNVVHAEDNMYTCSETGLTQIKNGIKEYSLNRVVVASCTPRTHEPLFRNACKEAGLNPFLFEFVNIRDQCSWVHFDNPELAQEKAKDLIRMGVAKARLLQPLDNIRVGVIPRALVIGGGISGMTCAMTLANQGYGVTLVEKEDRLGGLLNKLHKIFPDNRDASDILQIRDKVTNHKNINVLLSSNITDIKGYIGNYEVYVASNGVENKYDVGVIIVAVGSEVFVPHNFYNYNENNIITQLEFENRFKEGKITGNNFVMIQCVGSRTEERTYCSNVCCRASIKNAILLKEFNPNANVFILYRDLQTPGIEHELNYKKARNMGINFINFTEEKPPIVNDRSVIVYNLSIRKEIEIPYDMIILATPLISRNESQELAKMLKVPQDEYGFFLEAHVKLRPVDFATDGVFVCGTARWPCDISNCIAQANAAAARAGTILSKEYIEVEGSTATVDKELCIGCEVCIKLCPYNAISKDENNEIVINEVLCKGCGVCGASCIKNAISIRHFTNDQILSQIATLGGI
ncbi:MAG: CoB--CoM heterodisulfide reductase iron-sulfur subunit A family protein [Candidatus Helarchaeota archaeon]